MVWHFVRHSVYIYFVLIGCFSVQMFCAPYRVCFTAIRLRPPSGWVLISTWLWHVPQTSRWNTMQCYACLYLYVTFCCFMLAISPADCADKLSRCGERPRVPLHGDLDGARPLHCPGISFSRCSSGHWQIHDGCSTANRFSTQCPPGALTGNSSCRLSTHGSWRDLWMCSLRKRI